MVGGYEHVCGTVRGRGEGMSMLWDYCASCGRRIELSDVPEECVDVTIDGEDHTVCSRCFKRYTVKMPRGSMTWERHDLVDEPHRDGWL